MAETRQRRTQYGTDIPSRWKAVLLFVLLLTVISPAVVAICVPMNLVTVLTVVNPSEAKSIEYQLKAAFLYNFLKFIEWPETAPHNAGGKTPVTLCVVGTDFFGRYLDDLTKKEVKERPINILRLEGFEQYQKSRSNADREQYFQEMKTSMGGCSLLFISQSEEKLMNDWITRSDDMVILTVSDISGFMEKGGVIEFVMEENKIRFDVNIVAAEKKGLKISSQLLQLARKTIRKK